MKIIEKRGPKLNKWDTPTPAIGLCECGKQVCLQHPLTNECDCGRAYNLVGNEVKNRRLQEDERWADAHGEY